MDLGYLGDPAGMRALASTLRAEASSVEALMDSHRAAASSMQFEGPAAERIRERVTRRARSGANTIARLNDAARRLEVGALEVEAQIRAVLEERARAAAAREQR